MEGKTKTEINETPYIFVLESFGQGQLIFQINPINFKAHINDMRLNYLVPHG
jgi:hypothetical protein